MDLAGKKVFLQIVLMNSSKKKKKKKKKRQKTKNNPTYYCTIFDVKVLGVIRVIAYVALMQGHIGYCLGPN